MLCIAAALLIAPAGCGSGGTLPSPSATQTPIIAAQNGSPIQHIVIIMQENRTFDNLFNGFPGADTVQSGMATTRSFRSSPIRPWPTSAIPTTPTSLVASRGTTTAGRICAAG